LVADGEAIGGLLQKLTRTRSLDQSGCLDNQVGEYLPHLRWSNKLSLPKLFHFKDCLFVLSLGLLLSVASSIATAAPVPAPPAQTSPETADYMSLSLRLLFPSLPANLELSDITDPAFTNFTSGTDYLPLGTLSDPDTMLGSVQPITKTLSFNFKGGVRGRVFSNPAWLSVIPNYFANRNGKGQLDSIVSVRQDAAKGAGLLPAQRNWGQLRIVLNGFVLDYATTVLVGPPKNFMVDKGAKVFDLYHQILSQLDQRGDLGAAIGTQSHSNGSQFALGLVTDYLGENEYSQRMSEADFANRVAEVLSDKDYGGDGWVGFTKADVLIGAPGWVLGHAQNGGDTAR